MTQREFDRQMELLIEWGSKVDPNPVQAERDTQRLKEILDNLTQIEIVAEH